MYGTCAPLLPQQEASRFVVTFDNESMASRLEYFQARDQPPAAHHAGHLSSTNLCHANSILSSRPTARAKRSNNSNVIDVLSGSSERSTCLRLVCNRWASPTLL